METRSPIKLKGKDILLLLLYAPGKTAKIGEGIIGSTRLMKAMFLFNQEIKKEFQQDIEKFPDYIAWKYGPWSEELMDAVEFFEGISFISSDPYNGNNDVTVAEEEEFNKWENEFSDVAPVDPDEYQPKRYYLTATGMRYVEEVLWNKLSINQKKILSDFKTQITSLSLYSILRYVYKKYSEGKDDWTAKSVIKDEILSSK